MMKTKKSGLLVILALAMVLALSCSAWAVRNTTLPSNTSGVTVTADDDISVTGDNVFGAHAQNGGILSIPGYNISTTGETGLGAYARTDAVLTMRGNINTTGKNATGAYSHTRSDMTISGDITTLGESAFGAYAYSNSSLDMDGTITTSGNTAIGAYARDTAYLIMKGNVATSGENAMGAYAHTSSKILFNGNVTTTGTKAIGVESYNNSDLVITGDIQTSGEKAHGAYADLEATLVVNGNIVTSGQEANGLSAYDNASATVNGDITTSGARTSSVAVNQFADATINGNVTVNGVDSYGLSGANDGTINMNDGTLTVADESSSGVKLETGGVATLTSVDVVATTLFETITGGTLNATDSTLTGDILHLGTGGSAGAVAVNLTGSTLEGAVLASQGLGNRAGGTIDLTLEDSTWYVTGDTNTNGTITSSGDSAVDTTQAPDGTVTTIDEIVGEVALDIKPGDTLNVVNPNDNNSFSSSNPDVLEAVKNADGSWSLISKSDGTTELTYSYKDEFGATQEAKTGVTSGTGINTPTTGTSGGGSSGCNAGFGVLALLGLAFVYKRK